MVSGIHDAMSDTQQSRAERFRRRAQELRIQAAEVQSKAVRELFLEAADDFDRTAADIEQAERRNHNDDS